MLLRYRLTILTALLGAMLTLAGSLAAKSGNHPSIGGDYEVVFKGCFEGTGTAKVNGSGKKIVFIRGDLTDSANGGTGQFDVKNLTFSDEGRFSGTGTFDKASGEKIDITIVGRMEPPGNAIQKARFICTYTTATGRAGRVIGSH